MKRLVNHYEKHKTLYKLLKTSYLELNTIIAESYTINNRIDYRQLEIDTIKQEIDNGLYDANTLIELLKTDSETYIDAITDYIVTVAWYDIIDNSQYEYDTIDDLEFQAKNDIKMALLANPETVKTLYE